MTEEGMIDPENFVTINFQMFLYNLQEFSSLARGKLVVIFTEMVMSQNRLHQLIIISN